MGLWGLKFGVDGLRASQLATTTPSYYGYSASVRVRALIT